MKRTIRILESRWLCNIDLVFESSLQERIANLQLLDLPVIIDREMQHQSNA